MVIIPRCGLCEPESDPAPLMDGQLAATCAHCGGVVTRQRRWKQAAGVAVADDRFVCTPPDEMPLPRVKA